MALRLPEISVAEKQAIQRKVDAVDITLELVMQDMKEVSRLAARTELDVRNRFNEKLKAWRKVQDSELV